MTGIPRTSTNPAVIRMHELQDRRAAELAELRSNPPAKERRCPVCDDVPGEGFNTYCSTEHLLQGRPRRKIRKAS